MPIILLIRQIKYNLTYSRISFPFLRIGCLTPNKVLSCISTPRQKDWVMRLAAKAKVFLLITTVGSLYTKCNNRRNWNWNYTIALLVFSQAFGGRAEDDRRWWHFRIKSRLPWVYVDVAFLFAVLFPNRRTAKTYRRGVLISVLDPAHSIRG